METSQPGSRRGPLHSAHVAAGGKFAEFAGWQMPMQYPGGVLAEHAAVRGRVGVFDVSHLGTVWVAGTGATAFVNACFTADAGRMEVGHAQYTLCCNDRGGVIDDLIVYRIADDVVLCVPNASNTEQVARLLTAAAPGGVRVRNDHGAHAIIAVQGPDSARLLADIGVPTPERYMGVRVAHADVIAGEVMTCRTGYTGERGYELIVDAAVAPALWEALLMAGERFDARPCGLAARDTLRTEMGYPLHGHELTPEITPVEAGLSWAVGWNKPEFWGRDALLEQRRVGASRRSVGLRLPPGAIARPGMPVLAQPSCGVVGSQIGIVTSGTFSPTLRSPIALALVASGPGRAPRPTTLSVDIRGRIVEAAVTVPPFVTGRGPR